MQKHKVPKTVKSDFSAVDREGWLTCSFCQRVVGMFSDYRRLIQNKKYTIKYGTIGYTHNTFVTCKYTQAN